jgi:hypothetical protein
VGIRLFVEVLEHAPDALTWRERYALSVLAENANDKTRECWPGIEDDPAIAHRMRLPGRSSRYEVLKALRAKGALEGVTAGHRGRRAVYRIPALGPVTLDPGKGPGSPDAIDEEGSGDSGQSVQDPRTQPGRKGPGTPDPNEEKGSGNDPERVREPHGKRPGNPDPYSSAPSEEEVTTAPPQPAAREITAEEKLDFGRFWQLHPKSRDMDKTRAEWIAVVLAGADPKKITAAAQAYAHEATGTEFRFVKQSANWLREHRYEDKYAPAPEPTPRPGTRLPPWCGECADGARAAEREGHLRQIYDDRGNARPCPKCHPSQTAHAA